MATSRMRAGLLALVLLAWGTAGAGGDAGMDWVRRHAKPMSAGSAAELSDAQLKAFGDAVGDARVVALGEQTHGGREEFELKLRLLRYLHEQRGFDLLLLESGIFDMAQLKQAMAKGQKLDDLAPGNVFYMYANSDAGRQLMRYVDQRQSGPRPLHLAGIDSQLSGGLSQRELLPQLKAAGGGDEADWPLFERLADSLFKLERRAPSAVEQQRFEALASRLGGRLCTPAAGQGLLCRSLVGLQAQAATLWRNDYQRDHAMADNVLWHLQQNPGRKAVVWAHIFHVARGIKQDATHRFAGDVLGEKLGRDYYVLHLSALQGSYLEFGSGQAQAFAPALPRSLEAALGAQRASFAFLNAPRPLPKGLAGLPVRSVDFGYGPPVGRASGLGKHWDGVFYVREMRPVTMER